MSENYSPGHLSSMTTLLSCHIDTVDTYQDTANLWEAFGKPLESMAYTVQQTCDERTQLSAFANSLQSGHSLI